MIFGPHPDRRSYTLENMLARGQSAMHSFLSDPFGAAAADRGVLGAGATIHHGQILDGIGYAQCYRVAFDDGLPVTMCGYSGGASLGIIGAKSVASLVPGQGVWVIMHARSRYGRILDIDPALSFDPSRCRGDMIHQAARCGIQIDSVHNALLRDNKSGIIDFSNGRPRDSVLAGEAGWITETGMRITLDSFMAQLGTSEACGVTAFYRDGLLRVAGQAITMTTAGSTSIRADDDGEFLSFEGSNAYLWETMGATESGFSPFRTVSPQDYQLKTPHYSAIEPTFDDQQQIFRNLKFAGYLGQGGKRMVLLPPLEQDVARYAGGKAPVAVFSESIGLDGRYLLESAHGLTISKRMAIAGPRQRKLPADSQGDTPTNYRAAGLGVVGDVHPHLVASAVKTTDPDHPESQRLAAGSDLRAHHGNWLATHPFHYHKKDWELPEEGALGDEQRQKTITFADLVDKFSLAAPDAIRIKIDHRYGETGYVPNESYITLTNDGGVSIGCGFGAEIRLSGGDITLACPGDIKLEPGRNLLALAGRDTSLRSFGSVELSAATGSVRVKAEEHVQLLAGNGGKNGAVLIESRAPSTYIYTDKVGDDVESGGIQLKAGPGEVAISGESLYLRSGYKDNPGRITLDAGEGMGSVETYAEISTRFLRNQAVDYFLESNDTVRGTNSTDGKNSSLAGGLSIGGVVSISSSLSVGGNVTLSGGDVVKSSGAAQADQKADADRQVKAADDANSAGSDSFIAKIAKFWYGDKRPGEKKTREAIGFSFRTTAQYQTKDYYRYESRWQQLSRLAKDTLTTWKEPVVKSGSTKTQPYPGNDAWTVHETLYTQDLALFDPATGVAKDRDPAIYGLPTLAKPKKNPPDDHYTIIGS